MSEPVTFYLEDQEISETPLMRRGDWAVIHGEPTSPPVEQAYWMILHVPTKAIACDGGEEFAFCYTGREAMAAVIALDEAGVVPMIGAGQDAALDLVESVVAEIRANQ